MHARREGLALTLIALVLVGCGASAPPVEDETPTLHAPASDSAAYLIEVGGTLAEILRAPSEPVEALESAQRSARGADRRRVQRDLARAHLLLAEGLEGRDASRERRAATTSAEAASRGSHDDRLLAEMDFVQLFAAWRAGQRAAEGRATRFVTRHDDGPRDLVLLAYLVRGEVAFADEAWDDALTAYRAVLGHVDHPLYAFALYRSALVWNAQGRTDEARQALHEVRDLGCTASVSAPTMRVALEATSALGEAHHTDPSGHERPDACPEQPVSTQSIEDERPPVLSH